MKPFMWSVGPQEGVLLALYREFVISAMGLVCRHVTGAADGKAARESGGKGI